MVKKPLSRVHAPVITAPETRKVVKLRETPAPVNYDNLRVRFTPTSPTRPEDRRHRSPRPLEHYEDSGASRSQPPAVNYDYDKNYPPRQHTSQTDTEHIVRTMCREMALTRIPLAEPEKFDGRDPLLFPLWRVAYEALTANEAMSAAEKLNLLNKYLAGEAKAAVKGFLMLSPEEAYAESYKLLLRRYGDKSRLASDYLSRLRSWPKISGVDNTGLRRYIDFLNQGRTAMVNVKALRVLDDESENFNMIKKLPVWLGRKWTRWVAIYREDSEDYPTFPEFVEFLSREDRIAHDPASKALRKEDITRDQMRSGSFASESRSTAGPGSKFGTCIYCNERHTINACDKFRLTHFEFRMRFLRENRLCFGCLSRGHQVRDCRNKKDCNICKGGHPSVMHAEQVSTGEPTLPASATTCASKNSSSLAPRKSSMVVPVYVSHADRPEKKQMIYAMIDTQSDVTFVTDDTARELGLKGKDVRLSLSTMTSDSKIIRCKRYEGLQIHGFNRLHKLIFRVSTVGGPYP